MSDDIRSPILLVDDEAGIRTVLGITLADSGYQVTTAENGEDALRLFREIRPAIVGERTNVIGSRKFKEMIVKGEIEEASEIGRRQVRSARGRPPAAPPAGRHVCAGGRCPGRQSGEDAGWGCRTPGLSSGIECQWDGGRACASVPWPI